VYEKAGGDESTGWNSPVYIEERDSGYMLEGSLALVRGINLRKCFTILQGFLTRRLPAVLGTVVSVSSCLHKTPGSQLLSQLIYAGHIIGPQISTYCRSLPT